MSKNQILSRLRAKGHITDEEYQLLKEERPQGDLISRSALLKAMEEERQFLLARGQAGAEHILVHHCLPIINNATTVAAKRIEYRAYNDGFKDGVDQGIKLSERPHGEWIKTISENGVTSAARCSECGFGDNRYMLFNYCPNCGARMEADNERDKMD